MFFSHEASGEVKIALGHTRYNILFSGASLQRWCTHAVLDSLFRIWKWQQIFICLLLLAGNHAPIPRFFSNHTPLPTSEFNTFHSFFLLALISLTSLFLQFSFASICLRRNLKISRLKEHRADASFCVRTSSPTASHRKSCVNLPFQSTPQGKDNFFSQAFN